MGPVYTVNVPIHCRQVCIYVKTEFLYYSVFMMISAVTLTAEHLSAFQGTSMWQQIRNHSWSGSLWFLMLMINPQKIQEDMGSLEVDLFASHLTTEAIIMPLQLEGRPRGSSHQCIHACRNGLTWEATQTHLGTWLVIVSPRWKRRDPE